MPMYDYQCTECDHKFEKIVLKYDTEATVECPKCGSPSKFQMPLKSRSGVKFLFNYMGPSETQ